MMCLNIELLFCTLLTFYVTYVTGPPVDSPENSLGGLGVGLPLDLGLSHNAPQFVKSNQSPLHVGLSDDVKNSGRSSNGLDDPENTSSEISDLFAKRSDLSIQSSTVSSLTTSVAFVAKSEPLKSVLSPLHGGFSNNLNKTLIVPSEGGLMQDPSIVMSAQTINRTINGSNVASSTPEEIHMTGSEPGSSTEDTFMHHEDVPGAKKQMTPQESHISARKGATLPEKPEMTSSSVNVTMEQFTFPSTDTESTFKQEVHQQKITPRKGAEMPKIFPRKGVEDKINDMKSTDPLFSEKNKGAISTSIITNSTLAVEGQMPRTSPISPLASEATINLLDGVKDSRPTTDSVKIFQTATDSQKLSTPYVDSSSSVISPVLKPFQPELKADTGIDVINNANSNLTVSLSDSKNNTEDKSGIIASYPQLRKRLKPLKTTDTNVINSSPSPPEHTSSDHDYIVPIVVTILTIPMLVVLVLFLYKKGSEFWERRHYRRMDFLIDGMYND